MLKTRIFLGQYQEKRFVHDVQTYRDLIVVSSSEVDLIRDLEAVRHRVQQHTASTSKDGSSIWMGYTSAGLIGAPAGSCIWTELNNEPDTIPFGHYWFQVRTVRFRDNEVLIKLKILRSMQSADQSSSSRPRQSFGSSTTSTNNNENDSIFDTSTSSHSSTTEHIADFSQLLSTWRQSAHDSILWICSHQLTASNAVQALRMLSLMMVAAMTGSVYAIKYLGMFTLRFMEEFSKLMHVMMPFLLRCLDLLGKTIGGFYILIAMIWRDSVGGGAASRGGQQRGPQMAAIMNGDGRPHEERPAPPSYGTFSSNMGRERHRYSGASSTSGGYGSGRFRR